MRTRPKVLLSVWVTLSLLFFFLYIVLSTLVSRNYAEFEREIIHDDTERVGDALVSRSDDLYAKLGDWAQWDDTYEFVGDGNQDYLDSNLQNEAFGLLSVNLIAITSDTGKLLFSKSVEDGETGNFPDSLRALLEEHPYFTDPDESVLRRGVLTLPEGAVMFASRPVVTSDGASEPRGQLFFGYFLDAEDRDALADLTHLQVSMWRFDEVANATSFQPVVRGLENQSIFIPTVGSEETSIAGFLSIPDAITGEPALLLSAEKPRDIFAEGQKSIWLFLWTMIGAGLAIMLAVLGLFEFIVLRKLSRLDRAVAAISESGDVKARVLIEGTDELSQLGQEIDRMLESLEELSKRQAASDSQLRLIADITSIMIWMSGPDGKATYFNKGWVDFTGEPLEASLGDGWSKYFHPDEIAMVREKTSRAVNAREPFQIEYRLRRHDGEYRWILASGKPYFHGKQFQGYIGSGFDITERKQSEDYDRESRQETEKMNQLMVARELKMVELKAEIKKLQSELKQHGAIPPKA